MLDSYTHSVAQSTASNRLTQAKVYLTFSVHYGFHPLNPSGRQLCLYIQFLTNSFKAPTSVKNYLSGARTWIAQHGGALAAFATSEYLQMGFGITKRSSHTPKRAAPLEWHHIEAIANFFDATPSIPKCAKACILIGYHTFLRSSNLLAPSSTSWGSPHTVMAQDLRLCDEGLQITVYSTKTKSDSTPVQTMIPWNSNPVLCSATAWLRYSSEVKPWILGPAFLCDDGRPLTGNQLTGLMRLALHTASDINPSRVSMHSLRRGATHFALQQGLTLDQIKERGMWRSTSGVSPYLA